MNVGTNQFFLIAPPSGIKFSTVTMYMSMLINCCYKKKRRIKYVWNCAS